MLRYKMLVVTRDSALRRQVKRLTLALGAELVADGPADLAVVDVRDQAAPSMTRGDDHSALADAQRIVCLVPPAPAVESAALLADPRVTSLIAADVLSDEALIAAATKALRGEVFGLSKYLPWGTTIFTLSLDGYEEKNQAIEVLLAYATLGGCRGPVRERLQLAADEMFMNALYHAKAGPVVVQYGCSGRWFGLAVRDSAGELTRDRILQYLSRTPTIEQKESGAGLGLQEIARSATRLAFDLEPGRSTEVVALFDMDPTQKGRLGSRSIHVFHALPKVEATARQRSGAPLWAAAALLLAIVSSLGTIYYQKRFLPAAPAAVVCPESPFTHR